MSKQIQGILILIGLVSIGASIYGYFRDGQLESLSGTLIGLSLIILAFYDKKNNNKTVDKN